MLAVAAGAAAQRVYRSVGPDGKVIFSDQPLPRLGTGKIDRVSLKAKHAR